MDVKRRTSVSPQAAREYAHSDLQWVDWDFESSLCMKKSSVKILVKRDHYLVLCPRLRDESNEPETVGVAKSSV